jgi:5'-nucleotidase
MNDGHFDGASYRYLAANVVDRRTGRTLLPPYAIRTIGGVKIGFIGVVLKDTPAAMARKVVEGLDFEDETQTVNRLIPELKREGAAFVVVLLHQGGETTAEAINDPTCPGFTGDAIKIVDGFDAAVEVVITGHTHEEYVCRRPDGKLMTQAGNYGRMATRIDLRLDPVTGKVLDKSARTYVAVNDENMKDVAMDGMVQRYARLIAQRADVVVAHLAAPLERNANRAGEQPLGNVIADAYLFGAQNESDSGKAAQVAFVNPGGIRDDLTRGLNVTFGQLYSVHPFGNTLITVELTGAQIVRLLEQQWERPQPPSGNVLSVSAGFSYAWDARQPGGAAPGAGKRVVPGSMKLNGVPVDPAQTYRVVANSFLALGGDNFSVFTQGRRIQESERDLDVLMAYFQAKKTVVLPASNRIRRED